MQPETDCYTVSVHNFHLDGYGHVNNARYLEFLEAARWHFFRQQDLTDSLRQANMVVAELTVRYRRAAQLDDILHINSRIAAAQSRQIVMEQHIIHSGSRALCLHALITLMPTRADGRVFRLPETLLNTFTRLINPP